MGNAWNYVRESGDRLGQTWKDGWRGKVSVVGRAVSSLSLAGGCYMAYNAHCESDRLYAGAEDSIRGANAVRTHRPDLAGNGYRDAIAQLDLSRGKQAEITVDLCLGTLVAVGGFALTRRLARSPGVSSIPDVPYMPSIGVEEPPAAPEATPPPVEE